LQEKAKTGKVKNIPQRQISIIRVFPFVSRFISCSDWLQGTARIRRFCAHTEKSPEPAINLLDKGCNGTTNQSAA
jgi:hypothetical protein